LWKATEMILFGKFWYDNWKPRLGSNDTPTTAKGQATEVISPIGFCKQRI
jgi:hypothetical protein